MSYGYHSMDFNEKMKLKYKNHQEHDRFTKLCKDGINYGETHGTIFWTGGDQKEIINFFGKRSEEFDEVERDAYEYIEYKLEYYFEVICRRCEF